MNKIQRMLRKAKRQSGQALVEYALILALIAIVCIGILTQLGGNVDSKLGEVDSALSGTP
jgi:pilus assembly protein Flp/PilA